MIGDEADRHQRRAILVAGRDQGEARGWLREGVVDLHIEDPLIRRRLGCLASGEGINGSGEGCEAVLSQARLGELQLGVQRDALIRDYAEGLEGETAQPLRGVRAVGIGIRQQIVGNQVGEDLEIADEDLQDQAQPVLLDMDLGDVGRRLGTGQVDPVGACSLVRTK